MGEQANTNLIKMLYEAFGRGDIATILGHLSEDVRWEFEAPASIPYGGKRIGPAQTAGFFEGLGTTLDHMKLTMSEFVAQEDRVAAFGRFSATVKGTGRNFDTPVAHFFRIRNGKVSVFLNFGDTATIAAAYGAASSAAG